MGPQLFLQVAVIFIKVLVYFDYFRNCFYHARNPFQATLWRLLKKKVEPHCRRVNITLIWMAAIFWLRVVLLFRPGIVITDVPYQVE